YNPDGTLDAGFGDPIKGTDPQNPKGQSPLSGSVLTNIGGDAIANSLALTPDGKIIVAGSVAPSAFSSASNFALVRYNGDGSIDTTFGSNGIVTTKLGDFDASANRVLIVGRIGNPSYEILAAGHTSTSGGDFN